jgi:hypothetical protein
VRLPDFDRRDPEPHVWQHLLQWRHNGKLCERYRYLLVHSIVSFLRRTSTHNSLPANKRCH